MELSSPLYPVVILLTSGVVGMSLSKILSLSPIVGFFILGAAIGSHGLGLIDSHMPGLHLLGELGVCFLLFDVGLHLSLKDLRAAWLKFIVLGSLQFLFVTAFLSAALLYIGLDFEAALALGSIFSLSSTALVLKMLAEHHEETSPAGKRATEILVFQDIVAIIILVFLTGRQQGGAVSAADFIYPLFKMIAAAVVMVAIGRVGLKPLFKGLIAIKNDEVFTSFALLIVFFTSWLTESLGLSLALGAFLGGLALSESTYSYIIRTEIAPFRGLLLALFFLTVGMSLNLGLIYQNAAQVMLLLGAFYIIKAVANWVAFIAAGTEKPSATRLSFLLSQGSEFAFVLVAAALSAGIISGQVADLAISTVGLSLALTPLLGSAGCVLSRSQCHLQNDEMQAVAENVSGEVIIMEFDDYARDLAGVLLSAGIRYRGHDRDLERLTYAKSRGYNVFHSDPNRPRTLSMASAGKVRAIVSLVEDDDIIREVISALKKIPHKIPFIAATSSPERFELLKDLEVEHVYIKSKDSLPELVETLLSSISVPSSQIKDIVDRSQKSAILEGAFPRANTEVAVSAYI